MICFTREPTIFSASAIADQLNIGRAMDRVFRSTPIFYSGRMDDFIIYDRTLTDEEVKYLFNLRRGTIRLDDRWMLLADDK